MDSFNFSKVKSFLPSSANLPKMPSLQNLPFSVPQFPGARTPPANAAMNEKHMDFTRGVPPSQMDLPQIIEPRPIDEKSKSNLDLISECDNFPYLHATPERFFRHVNHYYHLQVSAYPGLCLGYVLPEVAAVFQGLKGWEVDNEGRRLVLAGGDTVEARSEIVATTFAAMRSLDHFHVLKGWRDELYSVYGPEREVLFHVERAASGLLGVATYGAHLTAYKREKKKESKSKGSDTAEGKGKDKGASLEAGQAEDARLEQEELKIWVPRRSRSKQTYPGMLDNTVAGGLAAGEQPLECIIREAQEEASMPSHVMRARCRAAGTVSYFHIRDGRAGGEVGLLQPECQYVYDIDLTGLDDVEPKPEDGEVEEFLLMGVDEIREAMAKGEFKNNTALVMLDFFVRHGILTAENERDYAEITSRLHRVTDFPTR